MAGQHLHVPQRTTNHRNCASGVRDERAPAESDLSSPAILLRGTKTEIGTRLHVLMCGGYARGAHVNSRDGRERVYLRW